MKPISESYLIERYFKPLSCSFSNETLSVNVFNLLDDATLLEVKQNKQLVVTSDSLLKGIHFFSNTPYALIARKALRVNLSDLAAKGAMPIGYHLAVSWPLSITEQDIQAFCLGLAQDQNCFQITLMGGDMTRLRSENLVINITAIGYTHHYISRLNAKPGDSVYLTGELGEAALGYTYLKAHPEDAILFDQENIPDRLMPYRKYYLPIPRLGFLFEDQSRYPLNLISSMDLSDGLLIDANRFANASNCAFHLWADELPVTGISRIRAFIRKRKTDLDLWNSLIDFGDDYELLLTAPQQVEDFLFNRSKELGISLKKIGYIKEGKGAALYTKDGKLLKTERSGYDHFSASI